MLSGSIHFRSISNERRSTSVWTSKEAFLKAKGTGLSGQLDEVEIVLANECCASQRNISELFLVELTVANGYVAALVWKLDRGSLTMRGNGEIQV